MQQQGAQASLSRPAYLILASLVQEPKHAIALWRAIEQAEGLYIEPGTLYRVLTQLERRGWIEALTTEQSPRLYHLTTSGLLVLERAEAGRQGENLREREHPGLRQGKEIIMRLILWILRLYPPAWRERYEMEMVALLWQHHITLWTVLDLFVGALDARLDPHYRRPRQLLPLRRFQTSWRLVIGALVFFWIALLPWLWMSVLGIPSETQCSNWGNNYALCTLRVAVGMQATSFGQRLVGDILGFLPFLFTAFMAILVLARGRKARTHLLLAIPVTILMLVVCLACGAWLVVLWPLLPHISQFYPQAPAGLAGMGLASALAVGSLVRAAFALRAISAASPKQGSSSFSSDQQAGKQDQGTNTAHLDPHIASASRSRVSSVSKGWTVVLVVLLLLFVLPWPFLVTPDDFNIASLLLVCITWFFAGVVGFITAQLVKSPDKKEAEVATRKPHHATSPLVWAVILPIAFFLFTLQLRGPSMLSEVSLPVPLWVKLLLYLFFAAFVSGMTALIVTIRSRWARFERTLKFLGAGVAVVLFIPMVFRTGGFLFGPLQSGPGGWLLISCMSIIPAFFVRIRSDKQQADGTAGPLSVGTAPKVWAIFLFILLVPTLLQLGPMPFAGGMIHMIVYIIALCVIPALVVKIRNSDREAEGATEPSRNSLSPRVWIIITPVLFLVFCVEIEYIGLPDYPGLVEVFFAWLLTGLASLIILLLLKLASRASATLPPEEALQQAHVQA